MEREEKQDKRGRFAWRFLHGVAELGVNLSNKVFFRKCSEQLINLALLIIISFIFRARNECADA